MKNVFNEVAKAVSTGSGLLLPYRTSDIIESSFYSPGAVRILPNRSLNNLRIWMMTDTQRADQREAPRMAIWTLLSIVAFEVVALLIMPFVLHRYGYINLHGINTVLVLGATLAGMLLKTLASFAITEDVKYERQGFDFCALGVGAILSSISLQLISEKDLFPYLSASSIWRNLNVYSADVRQQRLIMLLILLFVSVIFMLLSALICREIHVRRPWGVPFLKAISFCLGATVFAAYVNLLIGKG